jgi:hypothetical protein
MQSLLKPIILFCASFIVSEIKSQDSLRYFQPDSLRAVVSFLAADSLQGRANFSSSLEKAAIFIGTQFNNAALNYYPNTNSYYQPFIPSFFKPENNEQVTVEGKMQRSSSYFFYSSYQVVPTIYSNDFKIISFTDISYDAFIKAVNRALDTTSKPLLIIIPVKNKDWIKTFKDKQFSKPIHSLLIIADDKKSPLVTVDISDIARRRTLYNIVGVQQGKSLPDEVVLVTAHYDHIGVGVDSKDAIYNGANDNASGTAAMLSLANYFSAQQNNQRTIIFIAFAGEELGLLGSQHLASIINPKSVVAMFNLEMLGKVNPSGKKSLIITGNVPSRMHRIMNKYCKTIKIDTDNNTTEKLHMRSDHYPFALKGVPAYTFMCFTPGDKDYHQPSDEISRIDFKNFSDLVLGLLPGIEAIVSAKETPGKKR